MTLMTDNQIQRKQIQFILYLNDHKRQFFNCEILMYARLCMDFSSSHLIISTAALGHYSGVSPDILQSVSCQVNTNQILLSMSAYFATSLFFPKSNENKLVQISPMLVIVFIVVVNGETIIDRDPKASSQTGGKLAKSYSQ